MVISNYDRNVVVFREILRTADPFLQMKKEEPDRYLRLEHWLQKGAMIDPRDLYPAGSSKEKRRAEIANMLIPEASEPVWNPIFPWMLMLYMSWNI